MSKKILTAFYSRSGTTKKVAKNLSDCVKCDIEEIYDTKDRSGLLGYLSSGWDSIRGKPAQIKSIKKDPSRYDLVIIGTPVWVFGISSPVRSYISQNSGRFKKVAFFCTMGGAGGGRAFRIMESLCSIKPSNLLELGSRDISNGEYIEKIKKFSQDISKI